MNTILEKIDTENKLCYLMGDFNIDLFKSDSCDYASQISGGKNRNICENTETCQRVYSNAKIEAFKDIVKNL